MRRKKAEEQTTTPGARITPADVQQVEFRLAFRGYNERDVDAFLDRVTEDLAAYLEENQRLRGGGAVVDSAPSSGTDDARREAEEIVARAREEAASIVRSAEQQAAAIRAAGPAGSGDARAAVAPFLGREREFLQSLGSLVQDHAEEIKQMVLAIRARTDGPPAGSGESEAPSGAEAASAAEIRERLGEPEPPTADGEPEPAPKVVEPATEPAYSSEGAPAGEGRERSLRELFWGED
jgi:DivIVA domain-containing protein